MVVLTCPDCGGHDDATVDTNGEVHLACPYCHYVGYYLEVPKENFGKVLLMWSDGNPAENDYLLMTVRVQDSRVTYFVLVNTEVLHEGGSMSEAVKVYWAATDGGTKNDQV